MANLFQKFIYNVSAIAPLSFIFAFVWYLQKGTIVIPCIMIIVGIVLILLLAFFVVYGEKHLATITIRTDCITPYDAWMIGYIIAYMLPFASLVIQELNLIILTLVLVILIICVTLMNNAIPNPILYASRYHFYHISGKHGVSGYVLISKRKLRKAKDVKIVKPIFDFLFLDMEDE